eukprot:SAG31_NODE_12550_length_933_cov_1.219424_1_plen_214_part_00
MPFSQSGDLLYVPRGHSHVAAVPSPESNGDPSTGTADIDGPNGHSIHLTNTLHVQDFTWEALLRLVVTTGDARSAYDRVPKAATHATGGLLTAALSTGSWDSLMHPHPDLVEDLRQNYGGAGLCKTVSVELLLMASLHHSALDTPEEVMGRPPPRFRRPPPLRQAFSAFRSADASATATYSALLSGWKEGVQNDRQLNGMRMQLQQISLSFQH